VATQAPSQSSSAGFWLLLGLILLITLGKSVSDTLDPDFFWHLRVAEQLKRDGIGPIVDHLSFSSSKEPWTPYSWLAELAMKNVWDVCGYRATIVVSSMFSCGLILMIALSCLELAGPTRQLNCILATALAAYLSLPYLSFRPATAAIFLLSICAWLLLRDRRDPGSKTVWLVIPITAALANIHLTAVLVPLWIGCLLLGELFNRGSGARRYAVLLIATSIA
jgi:hypothetical protein